MYRNEHTANEALATMATERARWAAALAAPASRTARTVHKKMGFIARIVALFA